MVIAIDIKSICIARNAFTDLSLFGWKYISAANRIPCRIPRPQIRRRIFSESEDISNQISCINKNDEILYCKSCHFLLLSVFRWGSSCKFLKYSIECSFRIEAGFKSNGQDRIIFIFRIYQ